MVLQLLLVRSVRCQRFDQQDVGRWRLGRRRKYFRPQQFQSVHPLPFDSDASHSTFTMAPPAFRETTIAAWRAPDTYSGIL